MWWLKLLIAFGLSIEAFAGIGTPDLGAFTVKINGIIPERGIYYLKNKSPNTPKLTCTGPRTNEKAIIKICPVNETCTQESATEITLKEKSANYTCSYKEASDKATTIIVYAVDSAVTITDFYGQVVTEARITNDTHFTLRCDRADAPDAQVVWFKNNKPIRYDSSFLFNDTSKDLSIALVNAKNANRHGGYYMCEVTTSNSVTRGVAEIKSDPWVKTPVSYNKMEGGSAVLTCEVEGQPIAAVNWTVVGKPLPEGRYTAGYYNNVPGASLTIKDLVMSDYGTYVCTATLDGTETSMNSTTLLRVRSTLAALWPFLGIVVEVIILVAIIFVYERRRAKRELEEIEDAADQKKSLTASNNENKDMRQRKV